MQVKQASERGKPMLPPNRVVSSGPVTENVTDALKKNHLDPNDLQQMYSHAKSKDSSEAKKFEVPKEVKFLHKRLTLQSNEMNSAQGSVFFAKYGKKQEMVVVKHVSCFGCLFSDQYCAD